MSPGGVGRSEVWEDSGFAKEHHLAPLGTTVLRRGAAPGFYSQPGSGSMRERAAACGRPSCALGLAAPQLGEVGSRLPPPHRQRWLRRGSWLAAVALLCRGHRAGGRPGRLWVPPC